MSTFASEVSPRFFASTVRLAGSPFHLFCMHDSVFSVRGESETSDSWVLGFPQATAVTSSAAAETIGRVVFGDINQRLFIKVTIVGRAKEAAG